ncbi:GTPase Era [Phaeodactylibacter luteus]|uniref:GTPase Era n=1 Tax=Phaeodactylibacter luteus TaxID=1564516 RepID=A0A5C6RKJ4_9BACT|nr:GTPase Era [Phaeodactylibacter luteus]TXB62931.1 GTPase Era [Phaeodactylibacter luteus]
MHKSGFVNIIGRPNVGKSTLMNALVGERMSIITNKPQTTRHRIIGLVSGDDFQAVFSDTPGIIDTPSYLMQEAMNRFAHSTFEDGDIMLFVTEPAEKYEDEDPILQRLREVQVPLFLVINKIDTLADEALLQLIQEWNQRIPFTETLPVSAMQQTNTDRLLQVILQHLPEGPAYYPKDQLTDRPERFFISEIIREKILLLYQQEIPYSCEVIVTSFKEDTTKNGDPLIRIGAEIFVARKTQKSIIIGKGGGAIRKLGMEARKDMEEWLESKVFLELHVKVKENWRNDERSLKHFGY